jgi:beta-mannosidase
MRQRSDLATNEWLLRGWRQNDWELGRSFARDKDGTPDVRAIPVTVPGSVRAALVEAGIVASPFVGTQSRDSEWIESRHWSFTTVISEDFADAVVAHPESVAVLTCGGLDYQGRILVDSTEVGRFCGSFMLWEFDIGEAVRAGGRVLTIVFTDLPDGIGQVGWTTRIRAWKPRFNYGWDWTPRIVQVGVLESIGLELRDSAVLTEVRVESTLHGSTAMLAVSAAGPGGSDLRVSVAGPGHASSTTVSVGQAHTIPIDGAQPWRVHADEQALYDVTIDLLGADGSVEDTTTRRVGFRSVEWMPTEGAPDGAEPWLCVVNGRPVFLGGVNWVPIRPDFADLTADDIRSRLETYRELGVTIVRVWGGAALETTEFYDACDELGILVWQELPLSSSGLDNTPPDDDAYAAEYAEIAASYARRRAHHASLVLWGGGNELTDLADNPFDASPLTEAHPTIAAGRAALAAVDPHRRFVSTSPTGPTMFADPERRGQGRHHDVHGPWEWDTGDDAWNEYWAADDAILRSEVGVGGASGLDLLESFAMVAPTETLADRESIRALWSHSSSWWLQEFGRWDGSGTLAEWVDFSQKRQARMLATAARATLARFPVSAGFIVWLGHDTFPCAVSLSILDFWGRPKPAAYALAEVFREAAALER